MKYVNELTERYTALLPIKADIEAAVEKIYNYHIEFHKDHLDHVENADGATIHHYKGIQLRQIRSYPLRCNSGTITVVERYYNDSTVPESIVFYGSHNGAYFVGQCDTKFIETYQGNYKNIFQSMKIVPHSPTDN